MKKIISALIILTFLLSSCGTEEIVKEEVPVKYVKTEILEKKVFAEKLKLTGKVSSLNETSISPQISGIIKNINFNLGDKVNFGDVIANIDTQSNLTSINFNNALNSYNNTLSIYDLTKQSIQDDLKTAKLQFENSKTNKYNIYNTTEKQLELANNQLESIQNQKSNTEKTVDSNLNLAKANLDNTKLTLENFKKTSSDNLKSLETKKINLYNTLRVTITSALSSINSSLTFVDTTFGITQQNKNKNDKFEDYLGGQDSISKNNVKTIFSKTNLEYNDIFSKWGEDLNDSEVDLYFTKTLNLLNESIDLYNQMTISIDNSIICVDFSETFQNSLKTINNTNKGILLGLKTNFVSLNGQFEDLNNTINSTKNTIDSQTLSLEQALNIAKSSYNNTVTNNNTSLDNINSSETNSKTQLENTIANIESSRNIADNNLKISELQYNSAKSKYDSQLFSTKSQLDNTNGQMDLASQQLSNSSIKAPFSGVLTSSNVEVGTLVSPGMQAFSIADNANKIVKMDVNSDNLTFITIGKEVTIEKNGEIFDGTVFTVGVSADPNTKLYKIEIMLNNELDTSSLFLGDFIDVFIIKENSLDKFLIIPFSSLIPNSTGDYSVFVVGSGSLIESKRIKIGASNSNEIIVTDGLVEGDRIITNGSLNVDVGDKVEEIK